MSYQQLNDLEKFIFARWCYSLGSPVISDAEYTILLNLVTSQYPDNEYVNRSWSSDPCPTELLRKMGREDLIAKVVLSDKTESIPSLNSNLEVQEELYDFSGYGTLSMKHDGWNFQSNYYNGNLVSIKTRGRASDAIDADHIRKLVPNTIPAMGSVKIVQEVTVSKTNFPFCASMFGNVSERAAVSSVLARPEYTHLLSVHAFDVHGYTCNKCKFEVLREWGFEVPAYYEVHNYEEVLSALRTLSDEHSTYQFPTDGVVFDGHKRRAIRLLAWEEPIYYSFVTGYLEQYNSYRISPSVLIHPVLRGGTTQRRINITNWQRIIDYALRPNSPIAFRIASSAVADFDEVTTKSLQKQWDGRYEEFAERIKEDEEVKRCQRALYLNALG